MVLDEYIATGLCGVLDRQRLSHSMSDVCPGKHKVVGLNQQGVILELSPFLHTQKKCITSCQDSSCLC